MDTVDYLNDAPVETGEVPAGMKVHLWRGEALKAFAGRRLVAAQSCGMRLFRILAAAAERGEAQSEYDGMFWDAVIVVYLCRAGNAETVLAVRVPEQVSERALAWADAENFKPDSREFAELLDVFTGIVQEIMATATEPVPGPGQASAEGKKKAVSTGSLSSESSCAESREGRSQTS